MASSMNIYIYGIIDSSDELGESIHGLDGSEIYNIPYRDIGVAVSDLDGKMRDITQGRAVEHGRVVERLMTNCTVLPVKFCTVLAIREDVLSMMKDNYGDFKRDLERLRNKVEFGVKVIWSGEAIRERVAITHSGGNAKVNGLADSPAKRFLTKAYSSYKTDRELEEKAERYVAALDHLLSQVAVEKKLERLKTDNLLLNAVYLVDRNRQNDFKEAFENTKRIYGNLKYLFSGPWPPYSFVSLSGRLHPLRHSASEEVLETALQHEPGPQGDLI